MQKLHKCTKTYASVESVNYSIYQGLYVKYLPAFSTTLASRGPGPRHSHSLPSLSICSCPRGNGCAWLCWPRTDHGNDQWQIPRPCNEMYYKVPIIQPVATLTTCYYLLCIHQPCIPFIRSIKCGPVNSEHCEDPAFIVFIVYLSRIFDELLMIFFGVQFLITNDVRKISLSTKTRSHY